MKLTGHPVQTGQARRGRSTELTALSMSNGLPGNGISFHIVPLPACRQAGTPPVYPAMGGTGRFPAKWLF